MAVDTQEELTRRDLHYGSFQDVLDDAGRLADSEHHQIGNWSLGQILKHLSITMHGSMDGISMKVPWFLKLLKPVIKPRFIKGPFPSGFQLDPQAAAKLIPEPATSPEDGIAALREAIDRLDRETERAPHPAIGKLSVEEWNQLHLRHAEMHMSHLVPA